VTRFDCVVLIVVGYGLAMVSVTSDNYLAKPTSLVCMAFAAHGVVSFWRLR
jgi:hypothetical protein